MTYCNDILECIDLFCQAHSSGFWDKVLVPVDFSVFPVDCVFKWYCGLGMAIHCLIEF